MKTKETYVTEQWNSSLQRWVISQIWDNETGQWYHWDPEKQKWVPGVVTPNYMRHMGEGG